jgi:hypothetical protein
VFWQTKFPFWGYNFLCMIRCRQGATKFNTRIIVCSQSESLAHARFLTEDLAAEM